MKYGPWLRGFRVQNFKAIQDSHFVKLTPLTVLIGNNGSGKSSLIEGLETYQSIVLDGLDKSMRRWLGMNHVWNKRARHTQIGLGIGHETHQNPIRFTLRGRTEEGLFRTTMAVNTEPGDNGLFIQEEKTVLPDGNRWQRAKDHFWQGAPKSRIEWTKFSPVDPGESQIKDPLRRSIGRWQFLSLTPDSMGHPSPKVMTSSGAMTLNRDGSNLAQYLIRIRELDKDVFEGIVDSMRFVLDYAKNFEPVEVREIQPTMFLRLLEQVGDRKVEVPGWLISSGTLRILALLAVLRNPEPPPLVAIEEIENGLDPRTIHMVLNEIRGAVQGGHTQVITTTHSPYLLDLLPLQTIIVVQRESGGDPVFWRPSDSPEKEMQEWAKDFAPGQLYTAGRFKRGVKS